MAKQPAKPLMAVKHDFVDSLDAFIQASMLLHQAVSVALELGGFKESLATTLRQRADAWEAAYLSEARK